MNLLERINEMMNKVEEENLRKDELEHYHSALTLLRSKLKLELAKLKKEKARFMIHREPGESVASRLIEWEATESGQQKFDIEAGIGTLADLIDNVKARLYNTY